MGSWKNTITFLPFAILAFPGLGTITLLTDTELSHVPCSSQWFISKHDRSGGLMSTCVLEPVIWELSLLEARCCAKEAWAWLLNDDRLLEGG